jgi:hypothetical protein
LRRRTTADDCAARRRSICGNGKLRQRKGQKKKNQNPNERKDEWPDRYSRNRSQKRPKHQEKAENREGLPEGFHLCDYLPRRKARRKRKSAPNRREFHLEDNEGALHLFSRPLSGNGRLQGRNNI